MYDTEEKNGSYNFIETPEEITEKVIETPEEIVKKVIEPKTTKKEKKEKKEEVPQSNFVKIKYRANGITKEVGIGQANFMVKIGIADIVK